MGSASRHPAAVAVVLLCGLLAVTPAAATEIALRYQFGGYTGPPVYTQGQPVPFGAARPAGLTRVPPLRSAKPLYGTARMGTGGSRSLFLILDESQGPGQGYDILYADANGNGSMADETPLAAVDAQPGTRFGPIPLLVPVGARKVLAHMELVRGGRADAVVLSLRNLGWHEGMGLVAGRSCPIALIDANGNGVYGDPDRGSTFQGGTPGDLLLVDANGDGRFIQGYPIPTEVLPWSSLANLAGRLHSVAARADGSALTLAPVRTPLATLRSEWPRFTLILCSGERTLVVEGRNGQAKIPPGEWAIARWRVERTDDRGRAWQVSGAEWGPRAKAPRVRATAAQEGRLPLGGALSARVFAGRGEDGALEFGFGLATATGGTISEVRVDGAYPPAPEVALLDEGNREVARFRLEYG